MNAPAENDAQKMIFEVVSPTGIRRFFLQQSLQVMKDLLSNHPQMMGRDCAAKDSVVSQLSGSRESQLDHVISYVPEWYQKKWCSGGMCACMGCANGSGGLAALGVTEDEWKAWRSRQIQFIGIAAEAS